MKLSRSLVAFVAMVALVIFSVMMSSHPARAGTLDQPSVAATVQMDQTATVAEASQIVQPDQFDATAIASSRFELPKTPLRDGKPRAPDLCRTSRAEIASIAFGQQATSGTLAYHKVLLA